jgi:hypothetical protein
MNEVTMNNNTLLAAYSFLAALTENQNDLYNHVYVPICKRALSYYNSHYSSKSGKWSDIRDIIQNEYGINVPQVVVKHLINSTFNSLSKNEKKKANFEIFNKGEAFQIEKYTFIDLEEKYQRGIREANALQEAFVAYLHAECLFVDGIPSIYEFLEKNKKLIAAFFSNTEIKTPVEQSFFYHFEFLKHIELKNHNLYKIAENQYIGSLLAGYFEAGISLEPKFSSNDIYYIDTSIALRAFDLQKEEETEATKELLRLITNTGGKIKILSITVAEIKNVIDNTIKYYNNSTPTTTINEACCRLGKNRAWLMTFVSSLEEKIKEELNISIENLLPSFIEKYRKFKDVEELKLTRMKTGNALHDVLSYMYIRQLRGNSVFAFQKAKYWFLTTNSELLKFNKKHLIADIPEIIMADSLTGLLWLKEPAKLVDSIKKAGLNILLASTFNEEFASKELINEFNNVIQNTDEITEDDYQLLLESVAHQSAKKINSVVEIFITDKEKAKTEIYKIVEKERSRKIQNNMDIKKSQLDTKKKDEENSDLQKRLSEIESRFITFEEQSKKKNEKATSKQKKVKWIIVSLIIIIVFLLLIIVNMKFSIIPKIFNWIVSSGGLFGLGSFILNLIKYLKED